MGGRMFGRTSPLLPYYSSGVPKKSQSLNKFREKVPGRHGPSRFYGRRFGNRRSLSAIFTTLPPGQFTAILAGNNGGTGLGIIEVYNLR